MRTVVVDQNTGQRVQEGSLFPLSAGMMCASRLVSVANVFDPHTGTAELVTIIVIDPSTAQVAPMVPGVFA